MPTNQDFFPNLLGSPHFVPGRGQTIQGPGPVAYGQPNIGQLLFNQRAATENFLAQNAGRGQGEDAIFRNVGDQFALGLTGASPFATPLALGSLSEILLNRGRADPTAMNRQLAGVGRQTGENQANIAGNLARSGLSQSGLGAALQAAVGQSGAGQQQNLIAQDRRDAETRRRGDLQLFMDLIGNPSMNLGAFARDIRMGNSALSNQNRGQNMDFFGKALGALSGFDFSQFSNKNNGETLR